MAQKHLSIWEKLARLANVLFVPFLGLLSVVCLPVLLLAFPDTQMMLEPAIVLCYSVCFFVCIAKSCYKYRFDLILMPLAFILHSVATLVVAVLYLVILLIACSSKSKIKEELKASTNPIREPLANEQLQKAQISRQITPLLGAIITGDMDLVRTALQEHPEHLNTAYVQNGNTPLHVAALNGQTEIVRFLLEQPGIDKTLKNKDGKTAFDLAQEKGLAEITNLL